MTANAYRNLPTMSVSIPTTLEDVAQGLRQSAIAKIVVRVRLTSYDFSLLIIFVA